MNTHRLALHHIGGSLVAPGATLTALTMHGTDSRTIMENQGTPFIIDAWSLCQAAGIFQINSPMMHDDQDCLKFRNIAAQCYSLLPQPVKVPLVPGDTLNLRGTGSAVALDRENFSVLIQYTDPKAAVGRYITYQELILNMVHPVTLEFAVTAGVAGGYAGSLALSGAVTDKLKGYRDYAVLGMTTSIIQGALTMYGPDLGNLRIGVPGTTNREFNKDYFVSLSRNHAGPMIPVINASNKAATFIETVNDENAASPIVTLYLALLR